MQFCPKCGSPMPEGARFCAECGTQFRPSPPAGTAPVFEPAGPEPSGGQWGGGKTPRGGKGGKAWLIILIILILLVMALAAAFILFRGQKRKETEGEASGPAAQESSVSQLPAIGQTTPAPGQQGVTSGGENSSLPQLPALFGQESSGSAAASEEAAASQEVPGPAATEAPVQTPGETPAHPQTATPVPTVQLTPVPTPAGHIDSTDIHRYEVIIRDVTWNDAWNDAISRGGYLVRINSAAEMQAVCDALNAQNATNIHYYLGGSCDTATKQYHWIDEDGTFFDEVISDQSSWYGSYWYPGEPSYVDTELARNGKSVEEYWMNLFHVDGKWYFNDAYYDLVGMYPDWLKGKVGYIVEYE